MSHRKQKQKWDPLTCVPCQKEIICSGKAQALIQSGHALATSSAMTKEDMTEWIEILDEFIAKAESCLSG